MTSERIVTEFCKGATIDALAKQFLTEEKERIKAEHKSKKGRPTITYRECRSRVEDVVLREVWHKIYMVTQ